MKLLLTALLTTVSASAFAIVPTQVKRLVPADYDIARTYQDLQDPEYPVTDSSYVIADLNKDGIKDVAVVVEKTAEDVEGNFLSDYATSDRTLLVYFGQKNGGYKLVESNKSVMMNQGDGGAAAIYSDPFEGISVNPQGSIVLEYRGGSNTKWAYTIKVQYRTVKGKTAFYLVGRTSYNQDLSYDGEKDTYTLAEITEDYNLATGVREYVIIETVGNGTEEGVTGQPNKYTTKGIKTLAPISTLTSDQVFGWEE